MSHGRDRLHRLQNTRCRSDGQRLTPLWEARRAIIQDPAHLEDVIREGSGRAAAVAHRTLKEVNDAMNI